MAVTAPKDIGLAAFAFTQPISFTKQSLFYHINMKWLSLAILNLILYRVSAQPYQLTTYTTREGLSSNYITTVIKDKTGFLWAGTRNGLTRFDGNAFDAFYNNPNDSLSLASNEIQALHIDRQQRLWIGSIGGLSLYHPQQQQFSNYYPDSSMGKCGTWFCTLQQSDDGNIWVGTWYELLIFNPAIKKFQRSGWGDFAATHKPANGNNGRVIVVSLAPKGPQELWVLSTYGLYSVNTVTKKFQWHPYPGISDYYGCHISRIDATGCVWMGTYSHGIMCYNPATQTWQQYLPPPNWNSVAGYNRSYGITEWRGDTLLYAALDGLALFDSKEKRFLHHLPQAAFPVNNIYKSGNDYWLLSSESLHRMHPAQSLVKQVSPFTGHNYINKIYPLVNQPGYLVMGYSSKNQIGVWQEKMQQFMPFHLANGQPIQGELTGWLQLNDSMACLATDEAAYTIQLANRIARPITLPAKQINANELIARNIVTDNSGTVWLRLRGQGIVRYQPATGKSSFENFISPGQYQSYAAMYYNQKQQCLWVAVEHEGLYQYWPTTGRIQHHLLSGAQYAAMANITCISGDADGNMYMTDASRGLYHYNIRNGQFTLYTRQNGLPSNNCSFTVVDSSGNAWVATEEGIARMDITTGTATPLAKDFLSTSLSFIALGQNGNLYTCSENNYYQWNIHQLPQHSTHVPLYLRNIRINNQPVAIDSVYHLAYYQNNISLQVGAITADGVDFEYQLNNSGNWMLVESNHALNFNRLAPGNYQLQVRQKGSTNKLNITIHITQPWWLRTWFWLLAVAFVTTATLFFVKRHIRNIRKQALLKQQVAETKTMALRTQMNPHFIFNCISSIDNFIQDNDKENASAWLNKFAQLIRGILDNSQQPEIPFWKDWDTLRLYTQLEQLRASHSFDCDLQADEALLNGHYRIPPLIIQPYVENAIHHGLRHRYDNKGLLRIHAHLQGQQLLFTIEDNGIGRKKSAELKAFNNKEHNSYGMRLSSERVQLFNAAPGNITITDLIDAAGNAAGTKVTITLSV